MIRAIFLSACIFLLFSCDEDQDCYECILSTNIIEEVEENCSNTFTTDEVANLKNDCEMRGGRWRIK